jgi:CheY-like chemotaxis protein
MAEARWDIRMGARVYHHVPDGRLRLWIRTGKIKVDEMELRRADASDWRKPEDVAELKSLLKLHDTALLRKEGHPARSGKKPASGRMRIRRILLVDDEKDLCALLGGALSSRGFQMEFAHTQGEALKCLAGQPPDLVLLDLSLPDGEGLALLSHIRKTVPAVAVIITTAFGSEEVRAKAEKLGAIGFLDKPYHEEDIIRRIRRIGVSEAKSDPGGVKAGGERWKPS